MICTAASSAVRFDTVMDTSPKSASTPVIAHGPVVVSLCPLRDGIACVVDGIAGGHDLC
jgi:hypothetical protein